jgi:hypothetical protein
MEVIVILHRRNSPYAAVFLIFSGCLLIVYMRAILFSVSYFHTRVESFVGLCISLLLGEPVLGFIVWLLQGKDTRAVAGMIMTLPEHEAVN